MAERPVLGYWNVQGRAAPIRFLLTHLGVDFQDKHHHFAEAPNFVDQFDWAALKPTIDLAFPDLPYYYDGVIKMTQTLAILKLVARKYKPEYLGRNLVEQANADMLARNLNSALDYFAPKNIFAADAAAFEAERPEIEAYLKALGEKIKALRAGRKFLVSEEPTYADFLGYVFYYMVKNYNSALVEEAGLQNFMGSMEALENATAYKEKNDSLIFFAIFCKWNFP